MARMQAFLLVAALIACAATGMLAFLAWDAPRDAEAGSRAPRPVWTETQWPFPLDQWGKGKAFRCKPQDCGAEVALFVRAKIGFCNCLTGISDDVELDRMGDLDLIGAQVSPLSPGRAVTVGHMNGRSRAYRLPDGHLLGKSTLWVAFNDRCDMVVATAVLPHERPEAVEPAVIEFLNSPAVLGWAEIALGL